MALAVVVGLELVYVVQRDAVGVSKSLGWRTQPFESLTQGDPIADAGQRVVARLLEQLRVEGPQLRPVSIQSLVEPGDTRRGYEPRGQVVRVERLL